MQRCHGIVAEQPVAAMLTVGD
eukprot:COSAG02_NODE_45782_length_354_cov_0.796078_1_plen_21_part_01